MKKEIRLPEELILMDKRQLQDLDVYITLLGEMGFENARYVRKLADTAMTLSEDEARKLTARTEVHNIRNAATQIAQYFGLIQMLVSNINDDLKSINDKREIYAVSYADRMVEVNKKQSQEESEQQPVERLAETE